MSQYIGLLFLLLFSLFGSDESRAQTARQPLPQLPQQGYVVIPSLGLKATYVQTKRAGRAHVEYLDIINVFLPNSFVRQMMLENKDIGHPGLYLRDELLVTMTVLPDPVSGAVTWVPIKLDSLTGARQIAWEAVTSDCYVRLFNYEATREPATDWSRRRMDLLPIIKRGKQYYTTRQQVLTDYFVLRDYATWYPTVGDNATINCLARPFTPTDYAKELNAALAWKPAGQPAPKLRGELSGKLLLEQVEGNVYTFWSLPPSIADGDVSIFGASSLRFQPKVGLVSGKYPSYFGLTDESKDNTFFDLIQVTYLAQ